MACIRTQPLSPPRSRASHRLESRLVVPKPQVGLGGTARTAPRSPRNARLHDTFVSLAVWPTAFLGMVVWWYAVPWRPQCPVLLFVAAISPLGYELLWCGYLLLGIVVSCGAALVGSKAIATLVRSFANNSRHGKRRKNLRAIRPRPSSCRADPPGSGETGQRRGSPRDPPRKGDGPRRSSIGDSREPAQ